MGRDILLREYCLFITRNCSLYTSATAAHNTRRDMRHAGFIVLDSSA